MSGKTHELDGVTAKRDGRNEGFGSPPLPPIGRGDIVNQRDTAQIRIKQTTRERLKSLSAETGVSMSELVDRAVAAMPLDLIALVDAVLVTPSKGVTRMELECQHQHGLLYVVEGAENNWVCSHLRRPAHSMAGFFRELVALDENRVKAIMQRWGLYFRSLPLAEEEDSQVEASQIQDSE